MSPEDSKLVNRVYLVGATVVVLFLIGLVWVERAWDKQDKPDPGVVYPPYHITHVAAPTPPAGNVSSVNAVAGTVTLSAGNSGEPTQPAVASPSEARKWTSITKLDKSVRQAIYRESQQANHAAETDAQKQYPLPGFGAPPVTPAYYKEESDLADALSEKYIARIAHRHKLTKAEMDDICGEGASQFWPYEGFTPTKELLAEHGLTGDR